MDITKFFVSSLEMPIQGFTTAIITFSLFLHSVLYLITKEHAISGSNQVTDMVTEVLFDQLCRILLNLSREYSAKHLKTHPATSTNSLIISKHYWPMYHWQWYGMFWIMSRSFPSTYFYLSNLGFFFLNYAGFKKYFLQVKSWLPVLEYNQWFAPKSSVLSFIKTSPDYRTWQASPGYKTACRFILNLWKCTSFVKPVELKLKDLKSTVAVYKNCVFV